MTSNPYIKLPSLIDPAYVATGTRSVRLSARWVGLGCRQQSASDLACGARVCSCTARQALERLFSPALRLLPAATACIS